MPYRAWPLRIQDIIQSVERIQRTTAGMNFDDFTNIDELILQGILYNFIIIGEASVNVNDEIQSRYPEIPWRFMAGMRNVMAHEYFQVDETIIWNTIQNHLPALVPLLQDLLAREQPEI
ncbi:MAG: hypothetical protein Fur0025_26380 [Oscillatoriaceae cyanobacterium]